MDAVIKKGVEDLVTKLQKLDCTLLGNNDDAWLIELLFQPGFHRYHLVEWIFSKLKFNTPKISGPQNSPEEKMKNLQSAVSNLGICRNNCHDIIKGTASVKEQLMFWKILVDILWWKLQNTGISSEVRTDEACVLQEINRPRCISQEYDRNCKYVSKLCDSVNIKYLLVKNMQLFPPYIEKESEEIPDCHNIGACIFSKNHGTDLSSAVEKENFELPSKDFIDFSLPFEDEVEIVEGNISSTLVALKKCATEDFNDVFSILKPLTLETKSDELSVTVGPPFKEIITPLESLVKFKKTLSTISSSNIEVEHAVSHLSNLQLSEDHLCDLEFDGFAATLRAETVMEQT